jgi:hypothetical protein
MVKITWAFEDEQCSRANLSTGEVLFVFFNKHAGSPDAPNWFVSTGQEYLDPRKFKGFATREEAYAHLFEYLEKNPRPEYTKHTMCDGTTVLGFGSVDCWGVPTLQSFEAARWHEIQDGVKRYTYWPIDPSSNGEFLSNHDRTEIAHHKHHYGVPFFNWQWMVPEHTGLYACGGKHKHSPDPPKYKEIVPDGKGEYGWYIYIGPFPSIRNL